MKSAIAWALSTVACLAVFAAAAQEPPSSLDRLLDGMAKSAGFEGHFVEEVELALLTEPVRSHGVLYFVPPDRMARFTTQPVDTALLIDGGRVEFRDVDGSRLDLSSSPLARHFTENLLLVFSGDREALERRYAVRFEAEGERWQLALTPRHGVLDMAVTSITLSGAASDLRRMVVVDSEGARTVTHLDRVQHDRPFTPEELARLFEQARPLDASPGPQ